MNETGVRRTLPDQSSGSGHTFDTARHPSIINPIFSKRVCFYKSGDPQFNGLRMVINNRTFKTFDALLDSLSKKVPLPFGVRNITTPRGVHGISTLDELEDGKSYLCSESRKVKPFNLALARRKLPPWYHTRPVSSRHRTVQQAWIFPGRKNIHRQEPVVVRTPKKLVVFRNGDPSVTHTMLLHKKTTPSYESILSHISELMQFCVNKLHTPDGRRVDGLPGLILCSGTVVAVGREPFKPAVYRVQKSPIPTKWNTSRRGFRRQKVLNSKKKTPSYSSNSRNFSASSERYIVDQIHNSIAESSCDLPRNLTKSLELDSNCILESVAETEEDTWHGHGAEGQDCSLLNDDNIEKSFRVNQDGSMTVEMKVRLTLKEEETIQWTTTLSRSAVPEHNVACLPESEAEQELCSNKYDSHKSQSSAASINTIHKDGSKDDDSPSLPNGAFSDSCLEKEIKNHTNLVSPGRAPTPVFQKISKQQASMESIKTVMMNGTEERQVGTYSYGEQTENRTVVDPSCTVNQDSIRPVPKPRQLGSVDVKSREISAFKSSEMTEIIQTESDGDEVTETVLHIYEQQTCQDHFLANACAHDTSASGVTFEPDTKETGQFSSVDNEFGFWGPSTASKSVSIWRADSRSLTSDLHLSSLKAKTTQRQQSKDPAKGHVKPQQKEVTSVSSKSKLIKKKVRLVVTPRKRPKKNSRKGTERRKRVKPFSSAAFIKRIYGNKSHSAKKGKKLKKKPTQKWNKGVMMRSLPEPTTTMKTNTTDPNVSVDLKQRMSKQISFKTSSAIRQPRGVLTRQTSMHMEEKMQLSDISKSMSLPPFNSSSSVTKEYVENWLEKAHLDTTNSDKGRNTEEVFSLAQTKRCGERKDAALLEEKLEMSKTSEPAQENLMKPSVKLRVQSFENKSNTSVEKTAISHTTTTKTDNYNDSSQKNTQVKPLLNGICSETILPPTETLTEMALGDEVENPATPTDTLSMELPPPPPELLNNEYFTQDEPSAASSPLYRLSSMSSQRSENYPFTMSPTSDKDVLISPRTVDKTASVHTDKPSTLEGSELSRTPSIKRAPLVSNGSLERKMCLRKASLDKYTSGNDTTLEMTTLSPPISTVENEVPPHGTCSTGTQQPFKAPTGETQQSVLDQYTPSVCTSVSPASLTSDERLSTASILSSEAPVLSNVQLKETEMAKIAQKEAPSPKTLIKRTKLKSSPSPERKFQSKKSPVELQKTSQRSPPVTSRPLDKVVLPKIGIQKHSMPSVSPSTERKHLKTKELQRAAPYSQSLDVVSLPVRHKPSGRFLSRNFSLDNPPESISKTQKKISKRKSCQTQELEKLSAELEADHNDDDKVVTVDQNKPVTDTQVKLQQLSSTNQPSMKPVLERICYSIKSIRQITQNKRPSCLEKSNSLPDFSSHVASTFGSSSKALLAFLAVMTLREGLTNLNVDELNANNVSCAEALKMIDSLREIANIEDSHKLKTSLSDLQQSASKQLLQSWKGFQELGDRCRSRGSTPNISVVGLIAEAGPERDCGNEEHVIDELIDNLDIPEKLKEELASLSEGTKSESDNEGKMSVGTTEKLKLSATQNNQEMTNYLPSEDAISKDDKKNTDVRTIIQKFTQMDSLEPTSEAAKHKSTDQTSEINSDQDRSDFVAEFPSAEANSKQIPEERQLYCTTSTDLPSCRDVVHQENQEKQKQQPGYKHAKLTQVRANTQGEMSREGNFEKDGCIYKTEKQYLEFRQLTKQTQENIPENADQKGQEVSSANKDLEKNCEDVSEVSEQMNSENATEVACEEMKRTNSDFDDCESQSEVKRLSSNYYVEVNLRKNTTSATNSETLSEEEQPEMKCKALESQICSMGLNISTDDSTGNSDSEEPSSEEEQPVVDCKKLQVIIEESLSGNEEEQNEDRVYDCSNVEEQTKRGRRGLEALREETEEDQVSSGDEEHHAENLKIQSILDKVESNVLENQGLYNQTEDSSLTTSENVGKVFRFNADDDSGNDHSSCEEHVELKEDVDHISSSNEEELSYFEKQLSSEEEHANMDRNIEESRIQYQVTQLITQPEETNCQKVVENPQPQSADNITQSVAERVNLLEKQVSEAQKVNNTPKSSTIRRFSQRNTHVESEGESSESPTSEQALCTRSAPQSSLSFSYDSSGVITTEPKSSRVRSIREMFLAKSATEIQQRRFPSPNSSEMSELRPETSGSGGYQSQTSGELSSGEDDSARKSITKGFVRRTIEMLYSKKDAKPEEAHERPPSEPDQRKKEPSSIFSPFHAVRSKAVSELSYFSSTHALDAFSEATRCIAFNAQVGPGDSVPIDDGRWLLRENTAMRKSVSDPVGINKTFTNSPLDEELCKETEVKTPYSLFSTKPELEDKTKTLPRKCTYFSLPHASESEVCQDEQSTASRSSVNGDDALEAKDTSEDTKTWAERNGILPSVGVPDFKMKDNKVHPLVELPPEDEVVVVEQPGRGHGIVNRRVQEPDVLDLLYHFCGEHCPIL